MPRQVIKINPYSEKSIDEAIKQLKLLKQEISFKTIELINRLADIGIQTIESNKYSYGDSDFNDMRSYAWLEYDGNGARVTLVLSGKDVAFIEFGAGIHFNGSVGQSPNPFGSNLGYTIGSYGLGKGANDSWTYYDRELGRYKTSHGTKAAMPMAKADEEIKRQFVQIAKEVFG